jgi:hypothetical protein
MKNSRSSGAGSGQFLYTVNRRAERGLERRDQLLKLCKGQARQIQKLRGARLYIGEPYTGHLWCLLSWEAQYIIIGINSIVSGVLQFLFAPCQLTSAVAPTRTDQGQRLSQTLAAADARHGRGTDGPRLDAARGAALPCATLAAARGSVSKEWWWDRAKGGDLSR